MFRYFTVPSSPAIVGAINHRAQTTAQLVAVFAGAELCRASPNLLQRQKRTTAGDARWRQVRATVQRDSVNVLLHQTAH